MPQLQRAPGASTPGREQYTDLVRAAAAKYRVPEKLLAALIETESSWNPKAVSPKGAKGLGQLMDSTAAAYGVTNPFDPAQNISATAQHLSVLVNKYGGNVALALAAYNAGEPAVDQVKGVPNFPETIQFVKKVAATVERGDQPVMRPMTTPYPNPMTRPVRPKPTPQATGQMFPGGLPGQPTAMRADRGELGGGVTGLGDISNQQMEAVLRGIAEENAGVPLDMSRQYEELQPGEYGTYQGRGGAGASVNDLPSAFQRPEEYQGISGGPSIASLYSGGTFPAAESGGLGWLSRLFRPSGGRTFADESQSER